MKHDLETLKYKMERFPETIIPYDYLIQMIAELQELQKWYKERDIELVSIHVIIKEILGE